MYGSASVSDEALHEISSRFLSIVDPGSAAPSSPGPLVEPIFSFAPAVEVTHNSTVSPHERTGLYQPEENGLMSRLQKCTTWWMQSLRSPGKSSERAALPSDGDDWYLIWVSETSDVSRIAGDTCEDFSGSYIDHTGSEIIVQQQGCTAVARNLSHLSITVPVCGVVSGGVLSMFHLTGQLKDGCVCWSDETWWVRKFDSPDTSKSENLNLQGVSTVVDHHPPVVRPGAMGVPQRTSVGGSPGTSMGDPTGKLMGYPPSMPFKHDIHLESPFVPQRVGIKGIWVKFETEIVTWAIFSPLPAQYLTLFNFIVFLAPLTLMIWVLEDASVEYWLAPSFNCCYFIIIPIVFIAAHVFHVLTEKHSRRLIGFTVVGTASVLLIICIVFLMKGVPLWTKLVSRDCNEFEEKRELQMQWEAADEFFNTCLLNISASTGETVKVLEATMRIYDCAGYWSEFSSYPSWSYLQTIEDDLQCGGWCEEEWAMWTYSTVKDGCSSAVAVVIHSRSQYMLFFVAVYCVCVICSTVLGLAIIKRMLKQRGVDW